ncbi:MAG TPA: hypothetical protein VGD23_07160 [Sphingomicrobium sp.]
MKNSHGRHGGNQGKTDRHEAQQDKSRGMAESLSGARDQDEAEGHTSGKD